MIRIQPLLSYLLNKLEDIGTGEAMIVVAPNIRLHHPASISPSCQGPLPNVTVELEWETLPRCLISLNTWPSVGSILWGDLGGGALLEEVRHWGWPRGLYSFTILSVIFASNSLQKTWLFKFLFLPPCLLLAAVPLCHTECSGIITSNEVCLL